MWTASIQAWRVGHINGKYNAGLFFNIDAKQLGVRHFSRFLRSGLPESQQLVTLLFHHL
jgi:hypothetical protein